MIELIVVFSVVSALFLGVAVSLSVILRNLEKKLDECEFVIKGLEREIFYQDTKLKRIEAERDQWRKMALEEDAAKEVGICA